MANSVIIENNVLTARIAGCKAVIRLDWGSGEKSRPFSKFGIIFTQLFFDAQACTELDLALLSISKKIVELLSFCYCHLRFT